MLNPNQSIDKLATKAFNLLRDGACINETLCTLDIYTLLNDEEEREFAEKIHDKASSIGLVLETYLRPMSELETFIIHAKSSLSGIVRGEHLYLDAGHELEAKILLINLPNLIKTLQIPLGDKGFFAEIYFRYMGGE